MRAADKTIYRLFAFACVHLAVMIGCSAQPSIGNGLENNGTENLQEGNKPTEEEYGMEIKALLELLEDTSAPASDRAAAAYELGKLGNKAVVKRMANLLPGDWDVVTLEIVIAFGKIGSRKALPVLIEMRDTKRLWMPGRMKAAIEWAIGRIQKASTP